MSLYKNYYDLLRNIAYNTFFPSPVKFYKTELP